jgi:hypothetical protein
VLKFVFLVVGVVCGSKKLLMCTSSASPQQTQKINWSPCDALPQVWDVLTDYEALAAVVPNLAVSERLPMPPGSPSNLVRLRQVLCLNIPIRLSVTDVH